jgi:hypothetical protein
MKKEIEIERDRDREESVEKMGMGGSMSKIFREVQIEVERKKGTKQYIEKFYKTG